jgi:lysyl-tRNA synthetase class 2
MKKMLGRGIGHIYQVARVFRNEERSNTHAPEFTMLEWYRCPGALSEIMDDVEALIGNVASTLKGAWRPRAFERISVSDSFLRVGLPDPLRADFVSALGNASSDATVHVDDSWDDVFFRAFLTHVEPSFPADVVTILHGYPARMAALARLDAGDPRRAERFEVYAGRIELANAFGELTDPVEQERRFEHDLKMRRAQGTRLYPIDRELLTDLPGIAQRGGAAGIALGVDRLLMLCLGIESIQDVITFSPRE